MENQDFRSHVLTFQNTLVGNIASDIFGEEAVRKVMLQKKEEASTELEAGPEKFIMIPPRARTVSDLLPESFQETSTFPIPMMLTHVLDAIPTAYKIFLKSAFHYGDLRGNATIKMDYKFTEGDLLWNILDDHEARVETQNSKEIRFAQRVSGVVNGLIKVWIDVLKKAAKTQAVRTLDQDNLKWTRIQNYLLEPEISPVPLDENFFPQDGTLYQATPEKEGTPFALQAATKYLSNATAGYFSPEEIAIIFEEFAQNMRAQFEGSNGTPHKGRPHHLQQISRNLYIARHPEGQYALINLSPISS